MKHRAPGKEGSYGKGFAIVWRLGIAVILLLACYNEIFTTITLM